VSYLGRLWLGAQLFLAVAAAFLVSAPLVAQSSVPRFVYVAGEGSPNISAFRLNTATGALTPVPGSPFNGRSNPHALAVDPAGKFLFVANQTANNISVFVIDQTSGALTEVPNSPFASGSGTSPSVLTVDATSRFLFVANGVASANAAAGELDVYEINSSTGALTPSPHSSLPATAMQTAPLSLGIYAHPAGKWLYLTGGSFTASLIQQYQIDPATGDLTFITAIQDGENPRSLAGDPHGRYLFGGHGQLAGFIDGYTISPVDGSLSGYAGFNGVTAPGANVFPLHMTVDSSGTFLYTDLGQFMIPSVQGALVPIYPITLSSATIRNVPWAADLIGPFVFTADATAGFLDSFQIDPAAGTITAAPGSPYALSSGLRAIAVTGYPNQLAGPAATFSPNVFAFNGTLVGQSASFPITLTNSGFATLTVGAISITGANPADFSQTNNCPATLSPGANCTFDVTFAPQAAGERSGSLMIADNSAGSPHSVALSGEGLNPTPAVTLAPGSFTFPSALVGAAGASQGFTVTNSGTGTLHFSSIGLAGANPGDFSQTNNCGATLAVSASCTITGTFKPQALGTRTATITIVDDAPNSPQTVGLTGTGTLPAVSLAPASFTFPSAMVGATGSSQGFMLTNSGTATLHLSGISLGGPNPGDFSQTNTCGATVAVNANCMITVTFKPQAIGTRTANVSVADDAANSPQTIALSGTGIAPFSVTPASNAVTLVPGQSSQLGMQFTSLPNFTGTVSFACSGAPTGSTCSVSPSSLPVTGQTTTQLTLIVSSTASGAVFQPNFRPGSVNWRTPLPAQVLFGLFLSVIFWRGRKLANTFHFARLRFRHIATVAVFSAALIISGCGAAGTTVTPPAGPAAGSYPLTVVATSGNVAVSLNITLNVQ